MTTLRIILGTTAGLALAACGDSVPTTGTPPPPPAVVQHLYVGDDASNGALRAYALPLTASSVPVATVPMNKPFTIGGNPATLAVATLNDTLAFFALPLTSASVPYAIFNAGSDGTPLFLPAGSLDQGGNGKINLYTLPFTNASTPSSSITTAGFDPNDLAIDPLGNIYETSGGNTIAVVTGGVVTTTLTGPAGIGFRGLAASATQLVACTVSASTDNVYIYTLPLTATATPTATISFGADASEGCALDANGNLYVGTSSGKIYMYAPPFSSTSTPSVTITAPAIIYALFIGS